MRHRADAHGRTVAEAVVRLDAWRHHPTIEPGAIATHGMPSCIGLDRRAVGSTAQNRISDSDRQNGVISKGRDWREEPEVLPLCAKVFVDRPDYVSRDGSKHVRILSWSND